jgi:hypothetical protein
MEAYKQIVDFRNPREMIIPGFDKIRKKENFFFYPPNNISAKEWYHAFEKKIDHQISLKEYFPIFRLSDGEFVFLLGRYFNQYKLPKKIYYLLQHFKRTLYYRSTFYSSGRKGYCETYNFFKINKIRNNFLEYLKEIAKQGILCPNFSTHILTEPYQKDFIKLLEINNINLNLNNYFAYYFVNGYFLGNRMNSIFKKKKILFFTSCMKERNFLLEKNLMRLGASEVNFYYTSLNGAMCDIIDFDKIKIYPDLIFVAAGVGSSNILVQIKKLNCLSVDCGFMVDALSDINFAKKRIYYCNDENFEKKTWFN